MPDAGPLALLLRHRTARWHRIARLVTFLKERGQLDNTILVFMGEHGLLEGEHGMVDKRTAHEASLRIPLIVRYPALASGKVIAQQALTIDVAPSPIYATIVAFATRKTKDEPITQAFTYDRELGWHFLEVGEKQARMWNKEGYWEIKPWGTWTRMASK